MPSLKTKALMAPRVGGNSFGIEKTLGPAFILS